jgi:hypothetical protein
MKSILDFTGMIEVTSQSRPKNLLKAQLSIKAKLLFQKFAFSLDKRNVGCLRLDLPQNNAVDTTGSLIGKNSLTFHFKRSQSEFSFHPL